MTRFAEFMLHLFLACLIFSVLALLGYMIYAAWTNKPGDFLGPSPPPSPGITVVVRKPIGGIW